MYDHCGDASHIGFFGLKNHSQYVDGDAPLAYVINGILVHAPKITRVNPRLTLHLSAITGSSLTSGTSKEIKDVNSIQHICHSFIPIRTYLYDL